MPKKWIDRKYLSRNMVFNLKRKLLCVDWFYWPRPGEWESPNGFWGIAFKVTIPSCYIKCMLGRTRAQTQIKLNGCLFLEEVIPYVLLDLGAALISARATFWMLRPMLPGDPKLARQRGLGDNLDRDGQLAPFDRYRVRSPVVRPKPRSRRFAVVYKLSASP